MTFKEELLQKIENLQKESKINIENLKKVINETFQKYENVDIKEIVEVLKEKKLDKNHIKIVIKSFIESLNKELNEELQNLQAQKEEIVKKIENLQRELQNKTQNYLEKIKDFIIEEDLGDEIIKIIDEIEYKNEEIVSLMKQNIKKRFEEIINSSKNFEEDFINILNEEIENALKESELTIAQAKEIFKQAILAVKEKAEELNLDIEQYVKLSVETIEKDLNRKLNNLKNSLDFSKKEVFDKDFEKMAEKLEVIYIGMAEAIKEFTKQNENEIDELKENIDEFKNKISEILKEKLEFLQNEENLKKAKEKILKLTEEAKEKLEEISIKGAKIIKGAINGLIEGAKKAIEENSKNENTKNN